MLCVENVLEPITTEALTNEVYYYYLWERLYTLSDKNLLNIKQTMKKFTRVEGASITRQGYPCFYKEESL
jgi:hypothetical protein